MKITKKGISLLLAVITMLIPVATPVAQMQVNAMEIQNYALNATVTTSSDENSSLAGKYAVDGDLSTRWSSGWKDGEWIMIDLGGIYNIGSISIEWEAAYASKYSLLWSQDNITWHEASTSGNNSAGRTTNMFYNRPVRYIKLVCDRRATTYGCSLFEIEALGNANQKPQTPPEEVITSSTNLAYGKPVVSSSDENTSLTAKYAVDGNPSTRWSSAWRDGEWIMVDLGKLYKVGSVAIDWEAAYASEYTISWSQDNVTWYDAVYYRADAARALNHMMYNRPIRYIKITADKRGTTYGASIYEIRVFGSAYTEN